MSQDIKIWTDDCKFKFRVSGILIKENKILTVRINNNNFFCLPGGHVELMENTKDAIIREFKEETKLDVKVEKLLYITENFFNGNLGKIHELGFYYLLNSVKDINLNDFNLIEKDKEGDMKLEFRWININELDNFKPEFIKSELKKENKNCKHIVILDDKIV